MAQIILFQAEKLCSLALENLELSLERNHELTNTQTYHRTVNVLNATSAFEIDALNRGINSIRMELI